MLSRCIRSGTAGKEGAGNAPGMHAAQDDEAEPGLFYSLNPLWLRAVTVAGSLRPDCV